MGKDDDHGGDDPQDIVEPSALARGGRDLLAAAHDEAGRHVEQLNLSDGAVDEPGERVSAYCAALRHVSGTANSDLPAP